MREFFFYAMVALTCLGYALLACAGVGAIFVLILVFRSCRGSSVLEDGYGGQGDPP